ncbi:3-mercaptopyruvate sulfurtransferase [Grifola frondosa]|uniref:3-mercaptopyruvate sulfurtransferase n=1 Tax=Grifola frondosa TaxID=5627 RepID=A0A1C7MPR7_GRIFR|nr:3-mercaptopyruvate sulfurtransferase [Grifola frondosa]
MLAHLLSRRTALLPRFLSTKATPTSVFGDACPLVITTAQLKRTPKLPASVSFLDASWHMPNAPRNARKEFVEKHIPGARFLDLDEVASPSELGLKHMMPSPEVFAKACEGFGISPASHVVIYDTHGVFSSPRALFMFRAFGHNRSSILDGGLPAWEAHGCETESGEPAPAPETAYPPPQLDAQIIKSYEDMVANAALDPASDPSAFSVLDARSRGRFLGTDPEPRPGLSSGHIPHACSLPFTAFLQRNAAPGGTEYTSLRSSSAIIAELQDALGAARAQEVLEGRRSVVASCGSGMTAGVLWLGMQLAGWSSWTGYAMREGSKIEKGQ